MSFTSKAAVTRLKVGELRGELTQRGLDTSGVKNDLVDRLWDAIAVEVAQGVDSAGKGDAEETVAAQQSSNGESTSTESVSMDTSSDHSTLPSAPASAASAEASAEAAAAAAAEAEKKANEAATNAAKIKQLEETRQRLLAQIEASAAARKRELEEAALKAASATPPATATTAKLTAAQLKKRKKKANKLLRRQQELAAKKSADGNEGDTEGGEEDGDGDDDGTIANVEIEYVVQKVDDATAEEFSDVFAHFERGGKERTDDDEHDEDAMLLMMAGENGGEGSSGSAALVAAQAAAARIDTEKMLPRKATGEDGDDADDGDDEREGAGSTKLSKGMIRRQQRLTVAELKQLVETPEVVETHDVTAYDPRLLVFLKAYRNTIPVPQHWCQKRRYLQNKRGLESSGYELPDFIKQTGITEMRAAVAEQDEGKNLAAKMREKARPKMGRMEIDYQKLHDAFFRWQTRPRLSKVGDVYYEGKEYETNVTHRRPGMLSDELKEALGMRTDTVVPVPPPWLIAMQRYGPPPAYPSLRIPGLNAPIPSGAHFGYHPGGWGKPPVDEMGNPLYGDVFGKEAQGTGEVPDTDIDKGLWGIMEVDDEGSDDDDEEEEDDESGAESGDDDSDKAKDEEDNDDDVPIAETPSGLASQVSAGLETPSVIELRKQQVIESAMDSGEEQRRLYKVIPQQKAALGDSFLGSTHVYDMGGAKKDSVDIALDPSEIEGMDEATVRAHYEKKMQEKKAGGSGDREDLSGMVAEHIAKKRRRPDDKKDSSAAKKFKF